MITLYTFGPAFGLPDPSPFVTKAEVLLKMAEVPYETDTEGFNKAPKGKLPYIRDGEKIIADSSFIRQHLEETYGTDFDKGMTPEEKAVSYSFEKLCEDNLYWVVVHDRWALDDNFYAGPRTFFDAFPAPMRMLMVPMIRKKVVRDLKGQGTARHNEEEIATIGVQALTALSDYLGDKPYFMGDQPTGADATIFAFVASALCPHFQSLTLDKGGARDNLAAYRDRMMALYYPDLAESAA